MIAACSSDRSQMPPACPTAVLLEGAENISTHVPASGRRPEDLQLVAALSGLVSACQVAGPDVDVALAFNVLGERGPAYGTPPVRLTYFIATVGPDRRIVDKQLFDIELAIPPDQVTAGLRETLTLRLPGMGQAEAARHRIYVGFQLDEAARRERLEPRSGPL